jgi:hypothetical protein
MPKASQQPGEPQEIPCEGSGRDLSLETESAATAEWPEGLKACIQHRAAIWSDTIVNENLKLLQIND